MIRRTDRLPKITCQPAESIEIPDGRRPLRDVDQLAKSISEIGLLNPILVTMRWDNGESVPILVAGLHRLEAIKKLGWYHAPCYELDVDDLEAKLIEIDENLVRHELTVLERAETLKERKEVYETLHPETKAGVAGGLARQGSANGIIPFAADTAAKMGVSESTIQQEVKIAADLTPEVKTLIRDTPLADKKVELLNLSRLEPDQQMEAASAIVSGEAAKVSDVVPKPAKVEPPLEIPEPVVGKPHNWDGDEPGEDFEDDIKWEPITLDAETREFFWYTLLRVFREGEWKLAHDLALEIEPFPGCLDKELCC